MYSLRSFLQEDRITLMKPNLDDQSSPGSYDREDCSFMKRFWNFGLYQVVVLYIHVSPYIYIYLSICISMDPCIYTYVYGALTWKSAVRVVYFKAADPWAKLGKVGPP